MKKYRVFLMAVMLIGTLESVSFARWLAEQPSDFAVILSLFCVAIPVIADVVFFITNWFGPDEIGKREE